MPDIFQNIDGLDESSRKRVIDRLEFRGAFEPFVRMRETYLAAAAIPAEAHVLDLGCGTGVVARAVAARPGFSGTVVGADLSASLIAEAERRAQAEGLQNIRFLAADSGAPQEADGSCDLVIAHTLISHVDKPKQVLAEARRLAKSSGKVILFDGDYASLVCRTGNRSEDETVVSAIMTAVSAQPYIMRDLPAHLRDVGLEASNVWGDVLVEAGQAEFFAGFVETFVPIAAQTGAIDQAKAENWLERFRAACLDGSFFGSCNYITYLARPV